MYTNCCSYFLATLYFSIWSHFDKSPSLVLSFYITCSFISLSTSISLSFINLHKQSFFLSINPPTYYFPFLKSCLTFTRKYNITSLSLFLSLSHTHTLFSPNPFKGRTQRLSERVVQTKFSILELFFVFCLNKLFVSVCLFSHFTFLKKIPL